jgi:hypothetical protein
MRLVGDEDLGAHCRHPGGLTSSDVVVSAGRKSRQDDLGNPDPAGDTSPFYRCASLSASCNWVCIEVSMERCR